MLHCHQKSEPCNIQDKCALIMLRRATSRHTVSSRLKWIYEMRLMLINDVTGWDGRVTQCPGEDWEFIQMMRVCCDLMTRDGGTAPSKCHYAAKPSLNTGHAGILVTIRRVLTLPGWLYPIQLFVCPRPNCETGSDKTGYLATLQSECQDG